MLYSFLLYSKVTQLSVYIHPLFCINPLRSGHRGARSGIPCAAQQVPISYLSQRFIRSPPVLGAVRAEEGDGEKVPCQLLREASDKQPHLKSVDGSREKERKKESFFFYFKVPM